MTAEKKPGYMATPPEMTEASAALALGTAYSLLGRQVVVTLDEGERVVASGQLLAFGDDGQVVIRDEMGFTHWCWPMLQIEEVQK